MVDVPFLRTAYNYDRNAASDESSLCCEDDSLTVQEPTEDCDINKIMERYAQTGILPGNATRATYGDFTGINDYHKAMNAVRFAQNAFNELPVQMRTKFENDPAKLLDFINDPDNAAEAVKMGLLSPSVLPKVSPEARPTERAVAQGDPKGGKQPKAAVRSSNEDVGGESGE